MNHIPLSRLTALVGHIEFEKTAELLGKIQAPDIIFSRQQTIEHDITHRCIGRTRIMQIIQREFCFQGSIGDQVIFYIGVHERWNKKSRRRTADHFFADYNYIPP